MFTKARHNRVFEDVIQQVETAIIDGDLKPGDRLPAERELQKMLDIGRGTLRESLRVLEQKGLIEIKPGAKGGIFVKKPNSDQMSDNLSFFIRCRRVSLKHLAQFRQDVEGKIAARVARSAAPEQIAQLKGFLAEVDRYLDEGLSRWDDFMETDAQIHLSLARFAGNPIHHFFLKTIYDNILLHNFTTYLPKEKETMRLIYRDLVALVNAVAEGDDEAARSVARCHVTMFNEYMERFVQEHGEESDVDVDQFLGNGK